MASRVVAAPPRWRDDLNPIFVLIVTYGCVGLLILAVGLVEFFVFEPLGQHSGLHARIAGVYAYNPETHRVQGRASTHFSEYQSVAALVDWRSVPSSTEVEAQWFNSLGNPVGQIGPASAGDLANADEDVVRLHTPPGLDKNLPGEYLFVVERVGAGRPVEVLARAVVLVTRS